MKLADLLDEFNVVIDSAEGLTELRSLILGLAVRGKLVPQDPNDEPASELLKKIEAEKNTFYEENNVRVPKIDPLNEMDLDRSKPNQWEIVRLFDLYDFEYGKSLPKKERNDNGKIPVFGSNGVIGSHDEHLINTPAIIIGRKGSVGALNICRKPFWPTDVTYYVCPYADMSIEFSYYHLLSLNLEELGKGIKPGLTRNEAYELVTLLPPLTEQHRIVQRIESLFAEVDELKAKLNLKSKLDEKLQMAVNAEVQQAPDADASKSAWNFITSNFDTLYHTPKAIDNLKKNILNEAVRGRLVPQDPKDDPASELLKNIIEKRDELLDENEIKRYNKRDKIIDDNCNWSIPESWGLIELQDLFKFIDYRGKNPKKSKEGKRLITAKNIRMGHINNKPIEYISEELYVDWMVRGFPKNGDLLFVTEGHTMGYVAQIDLDFEFALAQRTICLQPIYDISDTFYFYALMSPKFQRIIIDNKTGSAAGGIRAGRLRLIPVPLPPLEEQHRIVRHIEALFAICDRFKAQLEQRQDVNERLVKGLVGEVLEVGEG